MSLVGDMSLVGVICQLEAQKSEYKYPQEKICKSK